MQNNDDCICSVHNHSRCLPHRILLVSPNQNLNTSLCNQRTKKKKIRKRRTWSDLDEKISSARQPHHQMGNSSSESPTVLQRKQVRPTGYNHPECCGIIAHKKKQTKCCSRLFDKVLFHPPVLRRQIKARERLAHAKLNKYDHDQQVTSAWGCQWLN
jgi:hypothetical protein